MSIKQFLAACLIVLAWSSTCLAQDSSIYVGGGLILSQFGTHDASGGGASLFYRNTEIDTWLRGFAIEGGWAINRRWSVGAEFAQPFRETNLRSANSYIFSPSLVTSRYRESTMFGIARMQWPNMGRLRAALIAGAGFVRGRSLFRVAGRPALGSSGFGPLGDERESVAHLLALTGGAELVVVISSHLELVPQLRVLFVDRGSILDRTAFSRFGLERVMFHGGAGVRVRF